VSLNVKNRRAHELAALLAEMTGESLTGAVIMALEAKLEEERRKRGDVAARMLEFAHRFAAGLPPSLRSDLHGFDLYGEDGLPK
jgi:antitoxin VapB